MKIFASSGATNEWESRLLFFSGVLSELMA